MLAARHTATLATVSALILSGGAIASAAPGLGLGLASSATSETPAEVAEPDLSRALEVFEEAVDTDDRDVRDDEDGEGDDLDGDGLDADDLDADDLSSEDSGEPSEFAAWVQSIPSEWGCVKGRIISAHAAGAKTDVDGPQFDSIEAAVADLGLEGRCVDVALARNGVEVDDGAADGEVDAARGPAAQPGPPANAGPPADRGNAGGQAEREAGPPAQRGNAGGQAERGEAGPPAGRGQGGPPSGR